MDFEELVQAEIDPHTDMTPLTFEQMEKAIVKLAEIAQAAHGHFMPDCGADFWPDGCKGCRKYRICEQGTRLETACQELQEIMEED